MKKESLGKWPFALKNFQGFDKTSACFASMSVCLSLSRMQEQAVSTSQITEAFKKLLQMAAKSVPTPPRLTEEAKIKCEHCWNQ